MVAESGAWDHAVDDRINYIIQHLDRGSDFCQKDVPGLRELLVDYQSTDIKGEEFHRRLLRTFKDSENDGTYSKILQRHSAEEQEKIERFVAGESTKSLGKDFIIGPSPACRQEISRLQQAESVVHISSAGVSHLKGPAVQITAQHESIFSKFIHKLLEFFVPHKEDPGIQAFIDVPFKNWGLNVENTPHMTYVPTTTVAIQNIVKCAKEHDMSVRCSGYRHSWAPIFGKNGQVLISMLNLGTATELPNIASLPLPESPPTELEEISIVPGNPRVPGNSLVRVGCATTNERLRRWCVENNKVTIPLNVIMVEITLGGSNAPICHGAGRRNQTLSDLVRKIEYVDANGKLQTVDKMEHLRAASGCFGLMGVVTHITLEFAPMTYADLAPVKMPVIQAVPPPPGMNEEAIPPALLQYWKKLSPAQKQECQADFEKRATDDYYAEWFWFPYSDYAWVNSWNNTKDASGVVSFPDDAHIFLSFAQTVSMNILQNTPLLDKLIRVTHLSEAAVTLISRAAMLALPEKKVRTFLPDALHFQRAIQNVRVRDIEVEMPLVAKAGGPAGAIDFTTVQQAWWDAILLAYENTQTSPMRMPLEMRIMGGSDVIMAPQRGNTLGTCSIEVLTLHSQAEEWPKFAQSVLDKWMALKDPSTGQRLKTRPHWAKEWYGFTVDNKPWVERLKSVDYKDEREEFLRTLSEIGKESGWTLEDLKKRFSNDLFDQFFFDGVKLAH